MQNIKLIYLQNHLVASWFGFFIKKIYFLLIALLCDIGYYRIQINNCYIFVFFKINKLVAFKLVWANEDMN